MNGVIQCMKPPGMTSSDVVVALRRLLQQKRIGHTGTLDPGAAGVLTICVGKATRLSDFLLALDKEYLAIFRFGMATDTQDAYGEPVYTGEAAVTEETLKRVLPRFIGEIAQRPSAYSAIKVDGARAYRLAREGKSVDIPARIVTIHNIQIVRCLSQSDMLVRVSCGKGTYIRALAHDMGEALGCGAHLAALLRTRNGTAGLEDALTLEEIAMSVQAGQLGSVIMPMDQAVAHLPEAHVDEARRSLLANGHPVPRGLWRTQGDGVMQGAVRLYCAGSFYGIGHVQADGVLRVQCLLYDAIEA